MRCANATPCYIVSFCVSVRVLVFGVVSYSSLWPILYLECANLLKSPFNMLDCTDIFGIESVISISSFLVICRRSVVFAIVYDFDSAINDTSDMN
jgi:hypothetical protein